MIQRKRSYAQTRAIMDRESCFLKAVCSTWKSTVSWDFVIKQLADPEHVRPLKSLNYGADRSVIWNPLTQREEDRSNLIKGKARGRPKDTRYMKKTSMSLLPADGMMRFYGVYHPIHILFSLEVDFFLVSQLPPDHKQFANTCVITQRPLALYQYDRYGKAKQILNAELIRQALQGTEALNTLTWPLSAGTLLHLNEELKNKDFLILRDRLNEYVLNQRGQTLSYRGDMLRGENAIDEKYVFLDNASTDGRFWIKNNWGSRTSAVTIADVRKKNRDARVNHNVPSHNEALVRARPEDVIGLGVPNDVLTDRLNALFIKFRLLHEVKLDGFPLDVPIVIMAPEEKSGLREYTLGQQADDLFNALEPPPTLKYLSAPIALDMAQILINEKINPGSLLWQELMLRVHHKRLKGKLPDRLRLVAALESQNYDLADQIVDELSTKGGIFNAEKANSNLAFIRGWLETADRSKINLAKLQRSPLVKKGLDLDQMAPSVNQALLDLLAEPGVDIKKVKAFFVNAGEEKKQQYNLSHKKEGSLILQKAFIKGHEILKYFLEEHLDEFDEPALDNLLLSLCEHHTSRHYFLAKLLLTKRKDLKTHAVLSGNGNSALHCAVLAAKPDLEFIKLLVSAKGNLQAENSAAQSVLDLAIEQGDRELILYFFEQQTQFTQEQLGRALGVLYRTGRDDLIKILASNNPALVNTVIDLTTGNTLLHQLASEEKPHENGLALIQLCKMKAAQFAQLNKQGESPLSLIIKYKRWNELDQLLDRHTCTLNIDELREVCSLLLKKTEINVAQTVFRYVKLIHHQWPHVFNSSLTEQTLLYLIEQFKIDDFTQHDHEFILQLFDKVSGNLSKEAIIERAIDKKQIWLLTQSLNYFFNNINANLLFDTLQLLNKTDPNIIAAYLKKHPYGLRVVTDKGYNLLHLAALQEPPDNAFIEELLNNGLVHSLFSKYKSQTSGYGKFLQFNEGKTPLDILLNKKCFASLRMIFSKNYWMSQMANHVGELENICAQLLNLTKYDLAELLSDYIKNPAQIIDSQSGDTLLHLLILHDQPSSIRKLLKRVDHAALGKENKVSESPLIYAIKKGHYQIVQLLITKQLELGLDECDDRKLEEVYERLWSNNKPDLARLLISSLSLFKRDCIVRHAFDSMLYDAAHSQNSLKTVIELLLENASLVQQLRYRSIEGRKRVLEAVFDSPRANLSTLIDILKNLPLDNLADKRELGISLARRLISKAKTTQEVRNLIERFKAIDYLHNRQFSRWSIHGHVWENQDVSRTWLNLIDSAREKILALSKAYHYHASQADHEFMHRKTCWFYLFNSNNLGKAYDEAVHRNSNQDESPRRSCCFF